MSSSSKTASQPRRGFRYQDLTALRLALEMYVDNVNFQMYLEYRKAGGLDDIVVITDSEIHAYQVKHAENPLDNYQLKDFIEDTTKRVCFSKFSSGWSKLRSQFPSHHVIGHLLSNRSLEKTEGILNPSGRFTQEFIENKVRTERRTFREQLEKVCKLNDDDFRQFLASFRFELNQRSRCELEKHVRGSLLDHRLGISSSNVFHQLGTEIEKYTTELEEPLTAELFDRLLRETENRYLLPQKFSIDRSTFIQLQTLTERLERVLAEANGEYVVVTGLPGSGKSTSLSVYLDSLKNSRAFFVVRYYCFVRVNDNRQRQRLEAQSLRVNILSELQQEFSHLLERRFDFSEENFFLVLSTLGEYFEARRQKLIVFLDGLDHAERDNEVLQNVLTALPREIPRGVVFLIGTQELRHWKPLPLKQGRENRHVTMPLFSLAETREYLERQGLTLSKEQLKLIYRKSEGLPLYLRYVVQLIQEYGIDNFDIEALPPAEGGQIGTYYETLWDNFETSGFGKPRHLCAVAACLKFKVHTEDLFEFQNGIPRPDFNDCFRTIKYLLRIEDGLISIFHDSFRLFVLSQIDTGHKSEIIKVIFTKLRADKRSTRWYDHIFEYAFNAEEWDYIIQEVNREFIDNSLADLRPNVEIMEAIDCAVEAVKNTGDLVAMARLGFLKYRTNKRLGDFDRSLLAKALMQLRRKEEVIGFSCVLQDERWLIEDDI